MTRTAINKVWSSAGLGVTILLKNKNNTLSNYAKQPLITFSLQFTGMFSGKGC